MFNFIENHIKITLKLAKLCEFVNICQYEIFDQNMNSF